MEQILIEILFFLLFNCFQVLLMYICMFAMLTPKYNKYILLTVLTSANVCIEALVPTDMVWLRAIAVFVVFILPAFFFFKEKKVICAFAIGLEMATFLLMDIIISVITYEIYGDILTINFSQHTWDTIIYIIGTDVVFSAGTFLMYILWLRFFKKSHIRSISLFCLFPLSQFAFFAASSYHTWGMAKTDLIKNPFIIVAIGLSLLADVAMYRALIQNTKMQQLTQKLGEMQHEMDLQLQYYDGLAQKITEIREYHHDINNLITVTESLLQHNSYTDEGKAMLEDIKDRSHQMKLPVYSENPTVNAVLYHKKSTADEHNLRFEINIRREESFPFERTDICSVLANLLDNALREAKEVQNGFVEISSDRSFGMLRIEVKNSTTKTIDSEKAILKTDKPDQDKHGYGLEIIKNIAEKYNGKFVLTAKDGIARAGVILMITDKNAPELIVNREH